MGTTINDLRQISKPSPDFTIPVWTDEGTQKMPLEFLLPNTPAAHNNFIRGRCLNDFYSLNEIISMISQQDYSDIFVGDRIIANVPAIAATGYAGHADEVFLVAEIESHHTYGDTPVSRGHICLVPQGTLGSAKMNDTNTTEGAYEGSKMHKEVMPAVQTALEAAFGASHVLNTRELLSAVVDTTHPSAGNTAANGITAYSSNQWKDCKVRLMTELEVYGAHPFSSSGYDSFCGMGHQLSLFRLDHTAIFNRADWWLSSVNSSTLFCLVDSRGFVDSGSVSSSYGVRPRFIIG